MSLTFTPPDLAESLELYGFGIIRKALEPGSTDRLTTIQKSLFGLDVELKLQLASDSPLVPGYGSFGRARALDTGAPNLLETWDIPPDGLGNWPLEPEALDFLRSLGGRLFNLGRAALEAAETRMGVMAGTIATMVQPGDANIHLIHYFPTREVEDEASRRQSVHKDMTLLTLIPTPSTPGLSMKTTSGWVRPDVSPDDVIVQTGMIFERLTAGRWQASLHTVESEPENLRSSRYSAPYFLSPSADTILSTLHPFRSDMAGQDAPENVGDFRRSYYDRVFPERRGVSAP